MSAEKKTARRTNGKWETALVEKRAKREPFLRGSIHREIDEGFRHFWSRRKGVRIDFNASFRSS